MRILPNNRDHGWAPYAWLVFLAFFYIQPIMDHPSWRTLLIANATVVIFLVLYFSIFWVRPPLNYLLLVCMAAMGLGLANVNQGSSVFIIFTASFVPWVTGTSRRALIALSILVSAIALDAALFHPPFG